MWILTLYMDLIAVLADEVRDEFDKSTVGHEFPTNSIIRLILTDSMRHGLYVVDSDSVLAGKVGNEPNESSICHELSEASHSHGFNAP